MDIHQRLFPLGTLRRENSASESTPGSRAVSQRRPRLFLRIRAKTREIDLPMVRTTLGITDREPIIENAYNDNYDETLTYDFPNGPLHSNLSTAVSNYPDFNLAQEFLSKRSPAQFDAVRSAGLGVDLCIADYLGPFPAALLAEVLRHHLDFWVFSHGSSP